jgi:MoxR-like ATPase
VRSYGRQIIQCSTTGVDSGGSGDPWEKEIMVTFLADGRVLLEDIPGVGKTTLAVAFSRAMQLDSIYRREEE